MSCPRFIFGSGYTFHTQSHSLLGGADSVTKLLSSLLLASGIGSEPSDAIFTNVSLEPTWRWYFAMTPFETLFLGVILLQFAVLNIFGIFPLNISQFINGMPGRRRKRDVLKSSSSNHYIASELLKLLKKLDPDQCTFKAICELSLNPPTEGIPPALHLMLKALQELPAVQIKEKNAGEKLDPCTKIPTVRTTNSSDFKSETEDLGDILKFYEEAAKGGYNDVGIMNNGSSEHFPCQLSYPRCPIDRDEIIDYVKTISILDSF